MLQCVAVCCSVLQCMLQCALQCALHEGNSISNHRITRGPLEKWGRWGGAHSVF